jgi:hypothetical protein
VGALCHHADRASRPACLVRVVEPRADVATALRSIGWRAWCRLRD